MCLSCIISSQNQPSFSAQRRKALGLFASAGLFGTGVLTPSTYASTPPKPANSLNPEEALGRLMAGNQRYVDGTASAKDFASTRLQLSTGQNPYACILGCADSRVGPEFCFDETRGDLFVNRVAGNYVTTDLLASMEYAIAVLGTPLIMVLGHTQCGAVKAAIDAYQNETDFPGHIQSITTALMPAVKIAKTSGAPDLLDAATRQNILNNVAVLTNSTPILRKHVREGKLAVVGGLYHLDTGRVEVLKNT